MMCRWMAALLAAGLVLPAFATEEWVEVGADTEAKYYVDAGSVEVEGETIRIHKKAVYTNPLADNFTGRTVLFKESVGTVEIDCGRRINRVVAIDMIGVNGEVVWSSGRMPKRMWEDVRDNTHGAATFDYVCRTLNKS